MKEAPTVGILSLFMYSLFLIVICKIQTIQEVMFQFLHDENRINLGFIPPSPFVSLRLYIHIFEKRHIKRKQTFRNIKN